MFKKKNKFDKKKKKYTKVPYALSVLTLTEEECEYFSNLYNINIRLIPGGNLEVSSKCDKWLVFVEDHFMTLVHMNNRGNINNYHTQRRYYTYNYMFKSIVQHDQYKFESRSFVPSFA